MGEATAAPVGHCTSYLEEMWELIDSWLRENSKGRILAAEGS